VAERKRQAVVSVVSDVGVYGESLRTLGIQPVGANSFAKGPVQSINSLRLHHRIRE
jgi:hypothetical protein